MELQLYECPILGYSQLGRDLGVIPSLFQHQGIVIVECTFTLKMNEVA